VVVGYNRDQRGAETTAQEVERAGGVAHVVGADLATERGCLACHEAVAAKVGHVDVLVNNAGAGTRATLRSFEWRTWRDTFGTNVWGVARLTALMLPLLKRAPADADPNVVHVGSIVARTMAGESDAYNASKCALEAVARVQATELAPSRIRVNCVCPGLVLTAIHNTASDAEIARAVALTPLKRPGTVEEIASAVLFVAQNRALTGCSFNVDGGIWMR
jgi:NAD(P)-dependent dehydrogenase (short-subunit alcohol dehydrogenase family)